MSLNRRLNRRHFLQGAGACIALPSFISLAPKRVLAAAPAPATTASGAPLRMAFLYFPNGVNVDKWRPQGEGTEFGLSETMQPLAGYKKDFQVFSGFEHKNGWAGPDGAGDHARANATILTGARPKKTAGSDIRLGISVDQMAAQHVGGWTRFPSLELSCDGVRKSGSCDSGYSCAYQFNLAWRSETTPLAPEQNPRLVFERLFGSGSKEERKAEFQKRQSQQRSILDFVRDDAQRLHGRLGRSDQQKLDEYLTGVREIERRIEQAEKFGEAPDPGVPAPDGIPDDYREHIRLMYDMLLLAFQTDSTRIASFLLAHDGSNRNFKDIGVPEGHHELSHHKREKEKLEKIAKIDRFYVEQFAYFLERMRSVQDTDGRSLLENSMIVYASGLSDPDRHQHDDLPVIVAGHGGGALTPGRHVNLGEDTPMTNLYVRMLDEMGVHVDEFGDSTGRLATI
ncbi:MAG: DUF1552 domain-containing protein [Planctomycetes bacterium]|nr:DUF1552 domain-containing protein [Planctomycetota bacterium]